MKENAQGIIIILSRPRSALRFSASICRIVSLSPLSPLSPNLPLRFSSPDINGTSVSFSF